MEIKDSIELRDKGCPYCTGEEPKRIKHSYDDEDGMIATIRKSENSLAHWPTQMQLKFILQTPN